VDLFRSIEPRRPGVSSIEHHKSEARRRAPCACFPPMCQQDDAEGDEVRPITFDPVTRDADPLTTSAVLLQRRNLLERRQTLTEIYAEPSSRGVWVGPNNYGHLHSYHGHLDSWPLGASSPLCLSAGMGGPLLDTTVLYNVCLEKWPAAHSHNRL
jgi:hypothetical protein